MKCHFVVGQKVCCIKDEWESVLGNGEIKGLSIGEVLTIRAMLSYGGEVYLAFEEKLSDHGFCHTGFRPVVERKTDISIFTDMLIEQKQPVNA